jgi:MtN3 and saliva related transmembrane protein
LIPFENAFAPRAFSLRVLGGKAKREAAGNARLCRSERIEPEVWRGYACSGQGDAISMKQIIAVIFGLGLGCNALLFVPQILAVWRKKTDQGISLITFGGFSVLQAIGIVHGLYQGDLSLILGMAASLLTCGSVTALTIFYRVRRLRMGGAVQTD